MLFNEKLDLLMSVQNITNSRLARGISVDPSLVSRWRSGVRNPFNSSDYIRSIASYFAIHARMDYQKMALLEIIGMPFNKDLEDTCEISELLHKWLLDETSSDTQLIKGFFDKLKEYKQPNNMIDDVNTSSPLPSGVKSAVEIFHGVEGMREGVIKFLSVVASQSKPCTMLLYSDESIEWLTEDKAFYLKWGALLKDVIKKGHRIKIIHTINRDLSEMLLAIERWLPLYMTGAIEPYYYPKYREHIFKRTMFIAPNVIAFTSNTLSNHSHNAEQFLYTDCKLISSLTDEFNAYLNMCHPLMRIFTERTRYDFNKLQLEFEEQVGNTIYLSDMLSSTTMPEALLINLLERYSSDDEFKKSILSFQKQRFRAFEDNVKHNKYTEIIALPSQVGFLEGCDSLKHGDLFNNILLNYSTSDFCEHLEHILDLLEKYENYKLLICNKIPLQNMFLVSKDEVGVIVAKMDTSPITFAFNQRNMTNSFTVFLQDIIKGIHPKERSKKFIIKTLTEYINIIKKR